MGQEITFEVGRFYVCKHSRRGTVRFKCTNVDDEFVSGLWIEDGAPDLMLTDIAHAFRRSLIISASVIPGSQVML